MRLQLGGSGSAILCILLGLTGNGLADGYNEKKQATDNSSTSSPASSSFKTKLNQKPILLTPSDADISGIINGANDMRATLSSSLLKTFIRTNNMRAYHLDLHSYRSDAKYVGDPEFVDSLNEEHRARCSRHLSVYDSMLKSFSSSDPILEEIPTDALHLADSFGRPDADALTGSQFWLGSYEKCLDFGHKIDNQQSSEHAELIRGQYCIGIVQFPNWNPKDSRNSLKVGLCLPETCTSSMLSDDPNRLDRVEQMMKYQFGDNTPYNKLKLREVYCLPHETSQIRKYSLSAILFFIFIGFMITSAVLATIIDHLQTNVLPKNPISDAQNNLAPTNSAHNNKNNNNKIEWRNILIESFSIKRNLNKLLYIRESKNQDLNKAHQQPQYNNDHNDEQQMVDQFDKDVFFNSTTGIKCIGLIWIICAHTFLVSPIQSKNLLDMDKLTQTYVADIYLTAHLIVDTFFALSGLLASYLLFKEGIEKNVKLGRWIVLTLHRYWRLTPIYLICYWFTKSVGFLVNGGPMWDYMTAEQSPRLNCNRESWYEALFHLSDFKSPKEHCVPFAWFIANGIKFWIVTPLFLILIHRSLRRGYMITIGTIFANIILVFTLAMKSNVDVKSVVEFKPESADNMLNNMGEVYTRPYSRIGAYLVGLLAGHLIYLVDIGKLQVRLSKNTKIILWALCSVTVIVMTFVIRIAKGIQIDEAALPWVFGLCSSLIRPLWALCTCWFVFALAHGQAKWLAHFLSANFWRILVRLSFCAYLVQGEVLAQIKLSKSQSDKYTYTDLISTPMIIIFMTLIASFFMVILIEYPLNGIEEFLLPKRQSKTNNELGDKLKMMTPNGNVIEPKTNCKIKSS